MNYILRARTVSKKGVEDECSSMQCFLGSFVNYVTVREQVS